MSTAVDICNMALAYLGDRATVTSIDPPEGSPQADHCARFYPIALGQILRAGSWSFATVRKPLSRVTDVPKEANFAYAYPSDCIELLSVHDEGGSHIREYSVGRSGDALVLLTRVPVGWVVYSTSETPAEVLPSDLADALAHLLASKLAGAMLTGASGAQMAEEHLKIYLTLLKDVMQRDAKQFDQVSRYHSPLVGDMRLPAEPEVHYGID